MDIIVIRFMWISYDLLRKKCELCADYIMEKSIVNYMFSTYKKKGSFTCFLFLPNENLLETKQSIQLFEIFIFFNK